ncbi:ABC transporter permease [Clostridium rectalis]|uniref:ABC transporter permease n=1 Tax=Clostridium rectalis TaxID=2040295 RepID=UPI000F63EA2F|nr:FtsX-like permease family protein [Clostridium rectalis]
MYSKIALKNIKKSYKDYTIYFLTLILAVCIFYSFNSLDSQKALTDLKSSDGNYVFKLMDFMSFISVFVSIILGSLILYANNFLIKKRKKELGIYMILGMGKRKISKILVTETSIVGIISLITGIIIGMGVSQGVSLFALKLFEVSINEYTFAISTKAIGKTILYFVIMFLLVMMFNIFVISKYKIIDLLTAGRKNEYIKFKNTFIYLLTFILCVVLLGFSYKFILKIGLNLRDPMFKLSIVFVILGTMLFFFSLAGVILYVVNKNKRIYFKGLNIFLVKQINSKINTNFLSMSLICLMLFITILVLSTGISFKKGLEEGLKIKAPFDASIRISNNSKEDNLEEILDKIKFKRSKNEEYATCNKYLSGIKIDSLLSITDKDYKDGEVSFVKISDYNKILKLKGKKEVNLNKNEILIMSNDNNIIKQTNEKLKSSRKFYIKGKEYLVKNNKIIDENLATYIFADNVFTVIISDEFLYDYDKIAYSLLNVMYSDKNREKNNKKYSEINNNYKDGKYKSLNISYMSSYSKDDIYSTSKGATTSILFVGIYLGLVFLITSMAVLALQQLSEANDSIERYKALKRIGANSKMIDKTIFFQTLICFNIPMILALIHSVIGINVVSDYISVFTKIDISFSALITALIFSVVYTGYFYVTYTGYKNIVKRNI